MPVTPSGILSLPPECLRVLVANCPAWQAWTGTATAAAAKERIHYHDIPAPELAGEPYEREELTSRYPICRIDDWEPPRGYGDQPWLAKKVAERQYEFSGRLTIDFVDGVLEEDARNPVAVKQRFMNNVGGVVEELLGLAGTSAYLTQDEIDAGVSGIGIQSIEVYQGYARADETRQDTEGDTNRIQLLVNWGM